MAEYLLEMKQIVKQFPGTLALDHVDFTLEQGEVMALIGENGAGKSTLMNMISGIYKPSKGEIIVKGRKEVFRNPNDATRCGIGMVHQEFMLFPELTVLENLTMDKKGRGIPGQEGCQKRY